MWNPMRPAGALPLLVILAGAVSVLSAEEGRIPDLRARRAGRDVGRYLREVRRHTRHSGFPRPGHPTRAIEIIGSGLSVIEIDLNGFTLTGQPGQAINTINATNVRKLLIRNGTIKSETASPGCLFAGGASGTSLVIVEDLLLDDCGNSGVTLEDWTEHHGAAEHDRDRRQCSITINGLGAFPRGHRRQSRADRWRDGWRCGYRCQRTEYRSGGLAQQGRRWRWSGDLDRRRQLTATSRPTPCGTEAVPGSISTSRTVAVCATTPSCSRWGVGFLFSRSSDCLIVDNVARSK